LVLAGRLVLGGTTATDSLVAAGVNRDAAKLDVSSEVVATDPLEMLANSESIAWHPMREEYCVGQDDVEANAGMIMKHRPGTINFMF
jgi:hypothetical protein